MKNTLCALALIAGGVAPALAQPSVGISIGINQPGVYGRINIGDVPQPALVLPQPVVVAQPAYRVERSPIYLYVPPEHQQNWRRYCARYSACGQPVYFVREDWVRQRYQAEHPNWNRGRGYERGYERGYDRGHDRGPDRDHDRGHDRDDRRHRD